MSKFIRYLNHWLNSHLRFKQWLWFVLLWLGGLLTVLAMAYPLKWLAKSLG